jgi:uncharacterized DUF497 family protein
MIVKPFEWDEEKNRILQKERGLSFEAIVIAIENGHLIDICDHPTKTHQQIFEIEMEGYIVRVPFVEDDRKVFLKTAFHCRKATKKHLGKKSHGH